MTGNAPAGWYPSKLRPGEQRYWNGAGWTGTFSADGVTREDPQAHLEPNPGVPGRRRNLWLAIGGAVAGIIVLIVVLTAVFSSPAELDRDRVQTEIRQGISDQAGVDVTVDCPSSMPAERGATYRCVVEDPDGNTTLADITVENDEGDITWATR